MWLLRRRQVAERLTGRSHRPPPRHHQPPPFLLHHQLLQWPHLHPLPTFPLPLPPRTRRLAAGPLHLPRPRRSRLHAIFALPGRAEPVRLIQAGVSVQAAHLGSRVQDLSSAQLLVSTAMVCRFRESRITSKRMIVAIRCSIWMEVPLGDAREIVVPCEYVKFLVGVANEKMEANRRRTEKFHQALRRIWSSEGEVNGAGDEKTES